MEARLEALALHCFITSKKPTSATPHFVASLFAQAGGVMMCADQARPRFERSLTRIGLSLRWIV
jgi:hypothetical protein